ncbi:MAG: 2-phosphosulfolactate phosphatase [Solirubrobacteraceae bacterium]
MIDVAPTPSALRAASTAVVIDALRATSTIAQALAGGYRRVLCCADRARALELRAPGRVLAGEVACARPAGFDLGNSPREMATRRADELVLVTTNGTPAIVAAAAMADEVVLAALVNLAAVTAALPADLLIVCAGTEGRPSIEDTYVAGSIARRLSGPRTDAALRAEAEVAASRSALDAFAAGGAARRLERAGLGPDVPWCARFSVLDVVPRVVAVEDGVAVVALGA